MATITIDLEQGIHAEIIAAQTFTSPNVPLILDPITNSFSDFSPLIFYVLEITEVKGLINPKLLNNGKNSGFTADGTGSCVITLYIEDEQGNTDTDSIKLTIA